VRYRFVGLALNGQGLREFVRQNDLKIAVYEAVSAPGFISTPQTVVVSPDGRIVAAWSGAFLGITGNQIERFFSARLGDRNLQAGSER
jgi:hypothetical protein